MRRLVMTRRPDATKPGKGGLRLKSIGMALLLALPGALFIAAPAQAAIKPPTTADVLCKYDYVHVCIEFSGDDVWVYDTQADGASAVVSWDIVDTVGDSGTCVNSSGAGKWVECNEDWPENTTLQWSSYAYDYGEGHSIYGSDSQIYSQSTSYPGW